MNQMQENNDRDAMDRNNSSNNNSDEEPTIVTAETSGWELEQQLVVECPRRSSGQVCVCASCEAARTRLLHRQQTNSSSNNGKRKKPETTTENDNSEDEEPSLTTNSSKRTAVAASQKSSTDLVCVEVSKTKQGPPVMSDEERIAKMSTACKTILECIGEDPTREGLVKTPERWAKALMFMCHGYNLTPAQVTNNAVFAENHDEMVVVRDIDIHSLCEHHMVPFSGRVHIGYIPNGQIVGLSKLARIAEMYARRLQVQERLTRQIADAVVETVQPLGVAVVVECTHFCMVMRGVQKTAASTTTSSVRGCFESNPKTRAEFFSILHGKPKFC